MPFPSPSAPAAHHDSAADADQATPVDGRRARRDRNADAVVEALLALFEQGELHPTAQQLADRSGVSLRSVFRYFQDLNQLALEGFRVQWERSDPAFHLDPPPPGASLEARIAGFAAHRTTLYRTVAPMVRAALARADRLPYLQSAIEQRRTQVRDHLSTWFAPELDRLDEGRRHDELLNLDAIGSFETCEHLVARAGQSLAQLEAALTVMLTRQLTALG